MEVFEFYGNVFVGSLDFYDTEAGAKELGEYINKSVPCLSYMLIDLQDEDFRTESLPHVRGNDKKRIISRMQKKIFRDVDYCHTVSQGRNKEGRKDDQYLFSSLPNSDPLDKWMHVFSELDVPICGIWSVSYLGGELVRRIGIQEDNILLFSRQMRSAIRETIFKKGKLKVSRQAKLERRVRSDNSAETLATILASNVDIMHRYLVNQRIVTFTEEVFVYALVQDDLIEKVKDYCDDSSTLKFKFVGINSLFKLFNVKNCEHRQLDALFAYICSTQNPSKQQYLPNKHNVPHNRFRLNQAVRSSCLVLSLSFFVLASFFLLNAHEYSIETEDLSQRRQAMLERHDLLYSHNQHKIEAASKVRETVELMRDIQEYNSQAPQSQFIKISQTFDDSRFQRFSLDALIWEKYHPRKIQAITSEYQDPSVIRDSDQEFYEDESMGGDQFQPILRLAGRLDTKNLSYNQAVSLMGEFTKSIHRASKVSAFHIVQSPVDIRLGATFSDRSGVNALADSDKAQDDRYELRLILLPTLRGQSEDE